MSLLSDILNRLRQKQQPKQVQNNIPLATRATVALGQSPLGKGIVNFQRNIEQRTLPKVNLQQYTQNIQAPVPKFAAQLGAGAVEDVVNMPQRLLEAGGRVGLDIQQAREQRKAPTLARAIGNSAAIAEPLLDIATLGGGTILKSVFKNTGKNVVKAGAKQTSKQILKQAVKRGAIEGGSTGLVFGGLRGLSEGNEADLKNFAVGAGAGLTLGGLLGGGAAGVSAFKHLIKRTPQVEKQLRDNAGKYVAGTKPTKPEGMPQPQWDFQLEFNQKYKRNPYTPVYSSDLTEAVKYETSKKGLGLSIRDVTKDKAPLSTSKDFVKDQVKGGIQDQAQSAIEDPLKDQILNQPPDSPLKVYRASDTLYDPRRGQKDGVYVATSKNIANNFSEGGKRIVEDLEISPNAKILKFEDIPESIKKIDDWDVYSPTLAKYAREKGYDVVQSTEKTEFTVVNNKVLTKSIKDILQATPDAPRMSQKALQRTIAPQEVVDDIRTAIQQGDYKAAEALHSSLSEDFILPQFAKLVNEVDESSRIAMGGAASEVNEMKFGEYKDLANKMKNFLRLQGETKADGMLYREHIPERIFGVSSDEVATSLGKTESEFMAELTKDLTMVGGGNTSPQVISRFQNKIKQLQTIYDKLDPKFYRVLQAWDNKGRFVSAEATPKTLDKVFKNSQKAAEKTAKQEYKDWQTGLLKSEGTRTTTGAVNAATKDIKINTTSPVSRNPEQLKDIGNTSVGWRDVYRNFKAVYGKRFEEVKRIVLDPFDESKGAMVREKEALAKELESTIVKGLGIKKKSPESAAVQLFGEGKITHEELVAKFGQEKADNIVQADKYFRAKYDSMLDEVNAVRARIYPNNPEKIIPKRKDYYRHFREMSQGFEGLWNIFENPSGISSALSGPSAFSKPKSKWASFMQKRLGDQSDVDAVGGFLDYANASLYAKHIDPNIPNFRNLREELVQATAEGENAGKLNNFIEFLDDFSNDLAGKTNPGDRVIQKWIPGGRKTFQVLTWANNRIKANTIVGNLGSTVAQIFNVPQGIANAGPVHATKGFGRAMAGMFVKNDPINQSTFIKERYSRAFDRFDTGMINNTKHFASWITGVLDEVGTKYIWQSHYAKALAEKIPNPGKYADDITRNLVAGRGVGEVPIAQKSKTVQMIAPFQLEVGNMWWVMKDFVDEKSFGKLATLFVMNYLFNRAAEQVRGSAVTFDPIQAVIDAIGEMDEENGAVKAGGRLAGEVLSNVPFGQTVAANYPEYGAKIGDVQTPTRKELFGRSDPTRFGSGLLLNKGIQDPLFKILPGYGGNQLKKTLEGMLAMDKGYVENKGQQVQYPVNDNPIDKAKSIMFGKYATGEARDFFKEDRRALTDKQSEIYKSLSGDEREAYRQSIYKQREIENLQKQITEKTERGENADSLIEKLVKEAGAAKDVPSNKFQLAAQESVAKTQVEATGKRVIVGSKAFYLGENGKSTSFDMSRSREIAAMPEDNKYNKAIKESKAYSHAQNILELPDKALSEKEKLSLIEKMGISKEDVEYYQVAKDNTNLKTLYVMDKVSKISDHGQLMDELIKFKKTVNNKEVLSDEVVNNLVDEGLISKAEAKALKALKLDDKGTSIKTGATGKGKGGRRASGKARTKALLNFQKQQGLALSKLFQSQVKNEKQNNARNLEKVLQKRSPSNTGLSRIQSILTQSEEMVKKKPLKAILTSKQA